VHRKHWLALILCFSARLLPSSSVAAEKKINGESKPSLTSAAKPRKIAAGLDTTQDTASSVNGDDKAARFAEKAKYAQAMGNLRGGNMEDARKLLEELVKDDPEYGDAWASLGEVTAKQRNWEKSRQAYEKLTEIESRNHVGYEGLIRALSAERRYDEAIVTAKREVEEVSGLANGHWELGFLYLQTEKYTLAAHEYELSAKAWPTEARVQISLGRAYSGAHLKAKAQAAFDRAGKLDSSAAILNDVAYYTAEAGLDLKNPEVQSKRSVEETEQIVAELKLEDVNLDTRRILGNLAARWDTLGWIEFKKGDLNTAEKYLRAACDLTDSRTIQLHMGRVYESQSRKEEAIRAFSRVLLPSTEAALTFAGGVDINVAPTSLRPINSNEREARTHLAALLGGDEKIAELMKSESQRWNAERTVTVPYDGTSERHAQIVLMITRGPKVEDTRALQDVDQAKTLLERFPGKVPSQGFPSWSLKRIPRAVSIKCSAASAQCVMEFLTTEHWDQAFTNAKTGDVAANSSNSASAGQTEQPAPELKGSITDDNTYYNPALGMTIALSGKWVFFERTTYSTPEAEKKLQEEMERRRATCTGALCGEADINISIQTVSNGRPLQSIFITAFKLSVPYQNRQRFPLKTFAETMTRGNLDTWIVDEEWTEIPLSGKPAYRLMMHSKQNPAGKGFIYVADSNSFIFMLVGAATWQPDDLQAALEHMKLAGASH
jgi:tetratricopeptide (TPR) repeat protein